jgi:TfoX/Sxy family transcriptional regulator of competence genes
MATDLDFIHYVCDQVADTKIITYRKMFGEYMVYVNAKPILLVCDNTVYVKMLDCIAEEMKEAEIGEPYHGARPHYILDIDNAEFCRQVISILEPLTPVPKPKKRKTASE